VAGRIESSGRQASDGLMARAEELSLGIKSHVEDAERSLTNLVVNTSESLIPGLLFGIANAGSRIVDIEIEKPTLEDVFLDFARNKGERR